METLVTQVLATYLEHNPVLKNNMGFMRELENNIQDYANQFSQMAKVDRKSAFKAVVEAIDKLVKKIEERGVSCRKGCSYCCHINVDIGKDEAEMIVDYCKENGIEIDRDYLRVQAMYDRDTIIGSHVSKCVFLKNNECSIYEARPIMCRKYFVASDPKDCDTVNNNGAVPLLSMDPDLEVLLSGYETVVRVNDRLPVILLSL